MYPKKTSLVVSLVILEKRQERPIRKKVVVKL